MLVPKSIELAYRMFSSWYILPVLTGLGIVRFWGGKISACKELERNQSIDFGGGLHKWLAILHSGHWRFVDIPEDDPCPVVNMTGYHFNSDDVSMRRQGLVNVMRPTLLG
jgi:hypothetical protein